VSSEAFLVLDEIDEKKRKILSMNSKAKKEEGEDRP
jgi:hypothetical protein